MSSNSCVCRSSGKAFRIMTNENVTDVPSLCGNESELAVNLNTQDYEALGFCQSPVMGQYFSIGLILPNINASNREICNSSDRYFWRNDSSEEINCVDGLPLELPPSFDEDERCNLVSVLPGSLNQIYNATWTRCNSLQYSICQLESNTSISNLCKNVSTPTAIITTTTATTTTTTTATIITTTTTTTTTKTTTATTALPNNSTAIIIGSVLGVFVVLFFLWLLHFFRKRNNAKRNASENETREEVYYK